MRHPGAGVLLSGLLQVYFWDRFSTYGSYRWGRPSAMGVSSSPWTIRDGFQGCPASNERGLFYMLTADPVGEHGQAIPADFIRTRTLADLVHEHPHLASAFRGIHVLPARYITYRLDPEAHTPVDPQDFFFRGKDS
jgi:hypothetical protein